MKIVLLTMFDAKYRRFANSAVPSLRHYANTFSLEFLNVPPNWPYWKLW